MDETKIRAVIQGLRCLGDDGERRCSDCPYHGKGLKPCRIAICEDAESVIRMEDIPKWISVEERLPEKRGTYLCNYEFEESGRIVMSCDYLGDKRWSFMTAHVTHWAPMLEDPKVRGD